MKQASSIDIERTSSLMRFVDDSLKEDVRNGDLNMYEAAWISSDEYDQYQEYIRAAQNLTVRRRAGPSRWRTQKTTLSSGPA